MEFLLFLETLSKKILTLGKSISLAIDNDVVDDKDAVPTAFFFRSRGNIDGCEAVTFFCFLDYPFVSLYIPVQ